MVANGGDGPGTAWSAWGDSSPGGGDSVTCFLQELFWAKSPSIAHFLLIYLFPVDRSISYFTVNFLLLRVRQTPTVSLTCFTAHFFCAWLSLPSNRTAVVCRT